MASDASGAGSLDGSQRADRHALNQVLMDIMFLVIF
jgi:hypothetical protein